MIAVDAMGGDFAPHAAVMGALEAARYHAVPVMLFGDEKQIVLILNNAYSAWKKLPIHIVHCSQLINMHDEPSRAVLQKKDSSLVRAVYAVVEGTAKAVVSAGHSGAMLVASTLLIGRTKGVIRPAIGGFIPTVNGSLFCIDLGANTDCKPEYLEQFAYMGHTYVQLMQKIESPRIALLSNGHEQYKGSSAVKEAYALLQKAPIQFVGNKEARDIFDDSADVLVCDGFVGNVMLKTAQGAASTIMKWLSKEASRSWFSKMMLLASAPLLKQLKKRMDYARVGGAYLLGVKEPVVIAHGSSSSHAISQAILMAHAAVLDGRIALFNQKITQFLNTHATSGIIKTLSSKIPSAFKFSQK